MYSSSNRQASSSAPEQDPRLDAPGPGKTSRTGDPQFAPAQPSPGVGKSTVTGSLRNSASSSSLPSSAEGLVDRGGRRHDEQDAAHGLAEHAPPEAADSSFKSYVESKTLTYRCLTLDANGKVVQTGTAELRNSTLQRQFGDIDLVKVKLPDKLKREQLTGHLAKGVVWEGKQYRLDLFDTGDREQAWGVAASDASAVPQLRADEWNEYARQGNFAEPMTGLEGTFTVCLAPMGTPFHMVGGTPLEVNDGFGFIRQSVAAQMGVPVADTGKRKPRQRERPELERPAQPNTQMLQWLKEDNAVVTELVEHAIRNLSEALASSASNDTTLYRAATTGNFPVRYGTAVPVPGKNAVLSIDIGPGVKNVALHRSPADKPNWAQAPLEPADTELSRSIAELTAFQYRLQQKEAPHVSQPLLMMKGLLGVVPDAAWPDDFAAHQIVGCVTDCKVDSRWNDEAEVSAAKNANQPRAMSLAGNLAVTKILTPGSLVGVPAATMKQLSGDYDGDAVHVLSEPDCPMLFSRLADLDQRSNPKLTKNVVIHDPGAAPSGPGQPPQQGDHGARAEPRSMAARLAEIREADPIVGIWSTIADQLCTVDPDELHRLLESISKTMRIKLDDVPALWELVGLGIKVGTDLPKTNLSKLEFRGEKLTTAGLIEHGKQLIRFLRGRGIDNPHRKANAGSIVDDLRTGQPMMVRDAMQPSHYGMPGRIMRAVNEYLRVRQEGLAHSELPPRHGLEPGAKARGLQMLKESKGEQVDGFDTLVASVHTLIGDLMGLFANNRQNDPRSQDMDRWLLRAIDVVRPNTLRQQFEHATGEAASSADADTITQFFLQIVTRIENEFTAFLQAGPTPVQEGAPAENPPVVMSIDDLRRRFAGQPGPDVSMPPQEPASTSSLPLRQRIGTRARATAAARSPAETTRTVMSIHDLQQLFGPTQGASTIPGPDPRKPR